MKTTAALPAASLLTVCVALGGATAQAGEIARWVDADGVTHFGNPQFAPDQAVPVQVTPANRMDVPESLPASATRRGGPSVVVLEKEANRQTRGWRGHYWSVRQNPRHVRRR